MRVLRVYQRDILRPTHVVMIGLVIMTVGGGSLLLSASSAPAPVDGAIEWHEGSVLRSVVELLCLNYQAPTSHAGDVKNFILAVGAGLAMIVLGVGVCMRARSSDDDASDDDMIVTSSPATAPQPNLKAPKAHIAPLLAAQILAGLYLLWSFVSSRWSSAPQWAVSGSALLSLYFLWSFALGRGLRPASARVAAGAVVAITVLTAGVAVWYYYGRNPTLRAKFPFGNPTFLAAALIPGILMASSLAVEAFFRAARTRCARSLAVGLGSAAGLAVCLWAFRLADSRGATVGLVFGFLAAAFFALRSRLKLVPFGLALAVIVGGWMYYVQIAEAPSRAGRGATLRLRQYAWRYAWQMFTEQPLRGHGQAGFVLAGDSYAAEDLLNDPDVFQARLTHAHNEWLEVMGDLGSVGLALIVGSLLLTLAAGEAVLADPVPRPGRWALIGLMGALVGLVVEETFGVGLRASGVPTLFYTVLGLLWAMSSYPAAAPTGRFLITRNRRVAAGVAGCVIGLIALVLARQDFTAARNSYRAGESFYTDDYEETIRLAELATRRLNPQRALLNLYRLSEAHLRAAEYLQARALSRQRQAYETEPPNSRALALAEEDFRQSDQHCKEGSGWLKELVERSPEYLNHGRLDYRFNLTRARNAAIRNDHEQEQALLRNAVVAIERELARQPFDPTLAVDFLRAHLLLKDDSADWNAVIDTFARPLRRHRISRPYVDLLSQAIADRRFVERFEASVTMARRTLASSSPPENGADPLAIWAPEKLRLAAAVRFLAGDYAAARELLELAAPAYDPVAADVPFGAAGCYAELADCRFYSDPTHPAGALAGAEKALAVAPPSLEGRKLKTSVKTRMIDYALAGDDEETAKRLLRETAPPNTTSQAVQRELGLRYRRLCESLLERRDAGGVLRTPPTKLLANLKRWSARAIELDAADPYAHYVAADLAWYEKDAESTAAHLRESLRQGLPIELARQFLTLALAKDSKNDTLLALWRRIAPAGSADEPVSGAQAPSGGAEVPAAGPPPPDLKRLPRPAERALSDLAGDQRP